MSKKLTVIIGAGFSANADMPMAGKIAKYFDRDIREKLLRFSSSEWSWSDNKGDIDLNNGRLNFDWLAYSYIFNELIKSYKDEKGKFINYEDFYQFLVDKTRETNWSKMIFEKAKESLLDTKKYLAESENDEYYSSYLFAFKYPQSSKLLPILNYLISDLLFNIPKTEEQLKVIYSGFIKYINTFDEVDIFTLNHDLLLEKLFDLYGISYSKGFSSEYSPIKYNEHFVPVFTNNFDQDIRIYKLHGSIDLFRFNHYELDGLLWRPNGNYDYYLTTNYYIKHDAKRVDPNTGKIIQNMNFDIVPKFITGTNKVDIINNDKMYKELFTKYEDRIANAEKLFISGYSFCDQHINESLEKNKSLYFINHNPSKDFPFSTNGINIKSLKEL